MRKTILIFVEALPGSGKSTTAQYVASRLRQAQVDARQRQLTGGSGAMAMVTA